MAYFYPSAFSWPAGTDVVTVSYATSLPGTYTGFQWAGAFTAQQKADFAPVWNTINGLSGRKVQLLPDGDPTAMVRIGWGHFDNDSLNGVCIMDDTPGAPNIILLNADKPGITGMGIFDLGRVVLAHELGHGVFDFLDLPIVSGRSTLMDYSYGTFDSFTTWDQAVLVAEYGAPVPVTFDAAYYLAQNPDVAAAGVDANWHYNNAGRYEGRDPNKYFDTTGYLNKNPDVAASGINPLEHFVLYGDTEGRDTYMSGSHTASGWIF